MTWREGVEYWRRWAKLEDGLTVTDADRIGQFYLAFSTYCGQFKQSFDSDMPDDIVRQLGMDP